MLRKYVICVCVRVILFTSDCDSQVETHMKNNRKNRNVRFKKNSVTFDISSNLIMLHLSNLATIIHKKSAQPQTPNLDEYNCYTQHTVTKYPCIFV